MIDTDILVVGAGPAGLAASIYLGQHGINTHVVDRATFPRDKVCGDGISGWSVDMLNKLDPGLVPSLQSKSFALGSWGVRFVSPGLETLDIPYTPGNNHNSQRPAGFTVKREEFDNLLFTQLGKYASINTTLGIKLNQLYYEGNKIIVADSKGEARFRANLALFADGAQSPFSKIAFGGFVDKKHLMAGVRAYYNGVTGQNENNFIELHFLKEFSPGYFWIFPLSDGQFNVGIGMRSDKLVRQKINLNKSLEEIIHSKPHLRERFSGATKLTATKGFSLPLGSVKRPLSGNNFMLLGDAAGLIDPFTGEGIGNALASGYYAGQQALDCLNRGDFSRVSTINYENMVYDKLGKELKIGKIMQSLLKYPGLFNLVVNKARKNPELKRTISSMFNDPAIKARLKDPSFYLKILLNRQ